MPDVKVLEEFRKPVAAGSLFPVDIEKMTGNQAGSVGYLLFSAKRFFYYSNNISKAGELCNRIIARFPLSEEADEARLLLYDIEMEKRRSADSGKVDCLYCTRDLAAEVALCDPCRKFMNSLTQGMARQAGSVAGEDWDQKTIVSLATAVVALPIIGVASGGIIGIGLPEIICLLLMECLLWSTSKIRNLTKRVLYPQSFMASK
jgi:hypothetical protein